MLYEPVARVFGTVHVEEYCVPLEVIFVQLRDPPVLLLKKTAVFETGREHGVTLKDTTTGTSFPLRATELGVAVMPLMVGPVPAIAEQLKKPKFINESK